MPVPVDDKTREVLDLSTLKLPPYPRVERLEVENYTDATGMPSLRILVVLEESTDMDTVTGKDVSDLKFAIHDSLLAEGIELFPYIFLALPSELDEIDDEE